MTDIPEIEIRTTAALRLIGSKQEIMIVLSAFARKGFKWKTNGKFYPQREAPNRFAYYLNYLYVPSQDYGVVSSSSPAAVIDGEPKPRPFDAVLGGNNPPPTPTSHHTTHP